MRTRREMLKGFLCFSGASLLPIPIRAQDNEQDEPRLEFEWRVPTVHFDTVKGALKFEGEVKKEEGKKGIPAVFIFAGIVLIPYLAKAVLALRREIVHGGVVIDLRGEKVKIQTAKALSSQIILVIDANGEHTLHESQDISDPSQLIKVILSRK